MQSGYSSPYNSLTTVIKQLNMNSYELSRKFVDFSFENPSKIKPNHYALYFFSIEHCNRLGWKKEFGLPTTMTMEAIGIRSYNTYSKTFNDLVDFGFFNLIERSSNQYSANIIGLSNFNKALDKALDKAFIKHGTKQSESTEQSIDSINKPINNKQETSVHTHESFLIWFKECRKFIGLEYNVKKLSAWDKQLFNELKEYTTGDFKKAFKNFSSDKYYLDNNLIFPNHFLKEDNFIKYLNQPIKKELTLAEKLGGAVA